MKVVVLLATALCSLSAFAQEGRITKIAVEAVTHGATASLPGKVARQAAKQGIDATVPVLKLAQITNLPGQPLVQVRLNGLVALSSQNILPARVLPSIDVYKSISFVEKNQLYLPDAFTETSNVLYRGMRFAKLNALENILLQGLEIRRTGYSELYFAYVPSMAMNHAMPWVVTENIENPEIPVMVKIPVIDQLPVSRTGVTAQAYEDLPAKFMSDVMVFLEINGHADWYKAVLEDNKLTLVSVPTTLAPGYFSRWVDK